MALAQALATGKFEFVTLGTQGGPLPSATRSQPANVLVRPGEAYLIDVGDGTAGRLAAAHIPIQWIKGIFIGHLHFDHIGGLFAVLGLRHQMNDHTPLAIYGPPGTKDTVAGLLAAMRPSVEEGNGLPGEKTVPPETNIVIHELNGHADAKLDSFVVTAAVNTHFSFPSGSDMDKRYKSLSYRFDLPDRSIAYTGDTGPSRAVEKLAFKADLLITEMIDVPAALSQIHQQRIPLSPQDLADLTLHLSTQHLTTEQVGQMARRAMVGAVVLTHLASGGSPEPGAAARYVSEIRQQFSGKIVVANDLDRF
jgi:ribonuclease BN (tRNA processing enzyme)